MQLLQEQSMCSCEIDAGNAFRFRFFPREFHAWRREEASHMPPLEKMPGLGVHSIQILLEQRMGAVRFRQATHFVFHFFPREFHASRREEAGTRRSLTWIISLQEQSMGSCLIDAGNVAAKQAEERQADARGMARFGEICSQSGKFEGEGDEMVVAFEQGANYPLPCFARPLQLGR
jgi:hypothetical protein